MKFEHLAGKRALGNAHPNDYIRWAEGLLQAGAGSENVAILAGLGLERHPDSAEVEAYFQKSLKDLGLGLLPRGEGLRAYARYVCEQIISGGMESGERLEILETFYFNSDYNAIYRIWDELSEDVWRVENGEGSVFNTGLVRENIDSYIAGVAKQFIVLLDTSLPYDFFDLCACLNCGYIGKGDLEKIEKTWMPERLFRLIYRRGRTCRVICAKCGCPSPHNMSDYEGRKQYLDGNY